MEERGKTLASEIQQTFKKLMGILSVIDDDKFNSKPFPGSWSAGQAAEHILICGSGIPDRNTRKADRQYDLKLHDIMKIFLNFERKAKADPAVEPGDGPYDKEKIIRKLRDARDRLTAIATGRDLEALCLDMEFPTLGLLTRYEWLKFIIYHTQRHTRQIQHISSNL